MFIGRKERFPISYTASSFQKQVAQQISGLGGYEMSSGEQLVFARLETIRKGFKGLRTSILEGGRDFSTHRQLLAALEAVKPDVVKYIDEPKSSQLIGLIDNAYKIHYTYHDAGELKKSKDRIGGKIDTMQGLLQTPVVVGIPSVSEPSEADIIEATQYLSNSTLETKKEMSPWVKIGITAALTATVGLFVTQFWQKRI